MTDPRTQQLASRAIKGPAPVATGFLVVTGYERQKVFVIRLDTPDGPVGGFSLAAEGPFATAGVQWRGPETKDDYAKFLEFNLSPEIVELQCSALELSKPLEGIQDSVVPPYPASYSFLIKFSTGELHDPMMLITPL